jgi:hypothetical protein
MHIADLCAPVNTETCLPSRCLVMAVSSHFAIPTFRRQRTILRPALIMNFGLEDR